MSGTRIPSDKMGIYLNDHLAMATGAKALADRAASGSTNDDLVIVATHASQDLADGIEEIRNIMARANISVDKTKRLTALVSEKLGRFKLNGSLVSRSPVSDYTEAEGLASALSFHAALWPTLERYDHVASAEAAQRTTAAQTRALELISALAPLGDR